MFQCVSPLVASLRLIASILCILKNIPDVPFSKGSSSLASLLVRIFFTSRSHCWRRNKLSERREGVKCVQWRRLAGVVIQRYFLRGGSAIGFLACLITSS